MVRAALVPSVRRRAVAALRGRGRPAYVLALVLLAGMGGRAALATDLTVSISGVASDQGSVLVAVCTPDTFLAAGCPYTAAQPARSGQMTVAVGGVPPGEYAVQAFHDENDNLDLDRTFLGFPKEGMGFSNDAPMRFGPPRFSDAAIMVGAEGGEAALTMRYHDEDDLP